MFHKLLRCYGWLLTLLFTLGLALAACQPIQPVSAMKADTARQATQAVAQRFYEEVVNQKHFEIIPDIFDAKMVDHELGYGDFVKDTELFAAFPDLQIKVDHWAIDGDLVTAIVTVTGTQEGALWDAPATGNTVTWSQIDVWHVENGKVTEVWHNFATADILQQVGYQLVPPAK
jgi:predicted ester cyclase